MKRASEEHGGDISQGETMVSAGRFSKDSSA